MPSATTIQRTNAVLTFISVGVALFLLFDLVSSQADPNSKKQPYNFNGSIFGKRTNPITDYEVAGRTITSLCEIAVEACTIWLPQMGAAKK